MPDNLAEFRAALKDIKGLVVGVGTGSILAPVVAGLSSFQPPWPGGITYLSGLSELVAFVFTYSLMNENSKRAQRLTAIACGCTVLFLSVVYLSLASRFMLPINDDPHAQNVVVGCGLTRNAIVILEHDRTSYQQQCPGDYTRLLAGAEFETTRIWTSSSVEFIRDGLALLWLSSFACLAAMLMAFVLSQRPERTRRGRVAPSPRKPRRPSTPP